MGKTHKLLPAVIQINPTAKKREPVDIPVSMSLHGSPKRPGRTSTTKERERKTRGGLKKKERKQLLWIFSLQIKKKSNQSCLRRLIPGLLFWAGEE